MESLRRQLSTYNYLLTKYKKCCMHAIAWIRTRDHPHQWATLISLQLHCLESASLVVGEGNKMKWLLVLCTRSQGPHILQAGSTQVQQHTLKGSERQAHFLNFFQFAHSSPAKPCLTLRVNQDFVRKFAIWLKKSSGCSRVPILQIPDLGPI